MIFANFTEFHSRWINRTPCVLSSPLAASQSLPFIVPPSPSLPTPLRSAMIHLMAGRLTNTHFSATCPGVKPTAGKQQNLDLSPVHLASNTMPFALPNSAEVRGLGSQERATHRGLHAQAEGLRRGRCGELPDARELSVQCLIFCNDLVQVLLPGERASARRPRRSGVTVIALGGAEIRRHGARSHSRGFDRPAPAPTLHLCGLYVQKEGS